MARETWTLRRTKQCDKCPWKISTNPYDIPDGYSVERHRNLENTIAPPGEILHHVNAMACHESTQGRPEYCIGWLHQQLGVGNNIGLRIQMSSCADAGDIEVFGKQHQRFEDTLPDSEFYSNK